MRSARIRFWVPFGVALQAVVACGPAWALQPHGAPEGLYAHQIGHMAFLAGMLYVWFRTRRRVGPGWRLIRASFIFFALWSINTALTHWVHASLTPDQFLGDVPSLPSYFVPRSPVELLFYFGKMDHLLCVPGALLLGLGLNKIYHSGVRNGEKDSSRSRPQ